ncbi:MAG: GatB/YqeY domain-containing protein [Desulfobacterales bacterium]
MSKPTSADYGWVKGAGISLLDKIRLDLKAALRNKDYGVRDTLRQIMSEFPNLTVPIQLESGKKTTRLKKPEEITDDDILDIIRKLVKSEKIVLEAKKESSSEYLQTLERYLPHMITREEIAAWIRANIDLSDFKSPMQAMGPVMKHFGKQADGSLVKQILQEIDRG